MARSDKNSNAIPTTVANAVSWAYDRAIDKGVLGLPGAEHLANEYRAQTKNVEAAIDSLINWQVTQAGTAGFVTGLGGILTLPVALPANVASVVYLQIRMIAAIAHLRGFDIHSDKVRALVFACLAGSSVGDVLKDLGVQIGAKLTQNAVQQVAGATLVKINQAVGFRLVTKAGSQGIVNLSKFIPFAGGVVSGVYDAVTTRAIGSAANSLFNCAPEANSGDALPNGPTIPPSPSQIIAATDTNRTASAVAP